MREVAYTNPFRLQGRYCPNVLLRCMDYRFHEHLEAALRQPLINLGGMNAFASIGIPGGSRAILDEYTRKVAFAALDLAIRRHEAHRVIIADHVDCAAYGGSEAHHYPQDEEEFHLLKLRQAHALVKEAFPRLEIVLLYQDWERIREVEPRV